MSFRPQRALWLAASLAFLTSHAFSQTNVGQISGRITDASSAALPGATVTATSEQTGLAQTAVADAAGGYVFASLPAGSYAIRVELTGFKPAERVNVVLDAASRRAADFKLEVGDLTETVAVTATTSQVETQSGDVSRVITGAQVNNIALNGRNYVQLLQLLPGAAITTTDPFSLGLNTTGQAINGVRSPSTYFLVDGADNMDNGANGATITQPSLDTISEVKVLTASYSAEFGGRAGALINVVTKSGTREFRGSAYEFLRDSKFDARSFFDQGEPAPLSFNNAGYTIGGPISLGGFNADRSKLFFFFGQDWKKNHAGTTNVDTVPTLAERNGDFRASSLAAPKDPLTGLAFPDRIVPASRFSANGRALLGVYPAPNFSGPGGNYLVTGTNQTDSREEVMRLDYVLSTQTQVSYRFSHNDVQIFNPFQGGNTGIVPGIRPRPGWTTVGSVQQTLSNALLNSASVSATRNQIQAGPDNSLLSRSALLSGDLRVEPLRHRPRSHLDRLHCLQRRRLHQEPESHLSGPRRPHQGRGRACVQVRRANQLQPEGSEYAAARERRGDVHHLRPQYDRQRRRGRAPRQLPELHRGRARSAVAGALLAV